MSGSGFAGSHGFFGNLGKPIDAHYLRMAVDPAYAKFVQRYSRGGGYDGGGAKVGKAFAYKRPVFSDGGQAGSGDPYDSDIQDIEASTQPAQQRQPGQVEGMMHAMNQWGQGPSGVSQRFGNAGLYDIQRASAELQNGVDPDTAEKLQKQTNKMIDDAQKAKAFAEGGNVYKKPPTNLAATNDPHSNGVAARGGNSYSFGPVSSKFNNDGAEIAPMAHNDVTPRKLAHGGGCSCWRCGGRFAKGGRAQQTPAWKDRPFAVSQNTRAGHRLKIHAPHSGSGLVLNIHLSDVGPHALSLSHSGAVDASHIVERMAEHRLDSEARPTPFSVPRG